MSSPVLERARPQLEKPSQNQWSKVTSLFSSAPWVLDALHGIARLAELPANWDGYGSPRIDPRAIAAASRFVASVAFESLPSPHVVPVLGGSIGLHWRCGTRELEFTFQADGAVEFLKVIGPDIDSEESMEEGTLRRETETSGLKLLLWMIGTP
jgi:hypothetical protein